MKSLRFSHDGRDFPPNWSIENVELIVSNRMKRFRSRKKSFSFRIIKENLNFRFSIDRNFKDETNEIEFNLVDAEGSCRYFTAPSD